METPEDSPSRAASHERITVAMAQMQVRWGAAEKNVERAARMIHEAGQDGCDMVVLPECLDLGWTHPDAANRAEPIPGKRSQTLCAAAEREGVQVVAGLTERDGGHVYNTAILIDPSGEILLKHRKINILTIAQDVYTVGDRLGVAEVGPWGRVAVNICADNFASSLALAHSQSRMGARLLLSPSAWAVDADHDNERHPYGEMWRDAYATLASLYDVAVVGVSNVGWIEGGPWEGRKCIGCSLAVGPAGETLAKGPYGADAQEIVRVDIPLKGLTVKGTAIAAELKERGYDGP